MKENKKIEKFTPLKTATKNSLSSEFLTGYISKPNLKKLLSRVLKDARLVAPLKVYGDVIFQEVKSVNDIVFDYENCLNTPKDYLLLNDEPLFRYALKGNKVKRNNPRFPKTVIFGCRACDAKAVGLLDKFFSRTFEDSLYLNKRKNTFIITLVCKKIGKNCFCTSTKSGPYLKEGFDIQLVDIGKGYFLETGSVKGKDFLQRFSNLISAIDRNRKIKKEKVVKEAEKSKALDFDLKKVYNNLDKMNTKVALWKDLSQRCQNCGGCLLICPACSCFYVVDKIIGDKEGQRVRSLDACFYEGFTRMSGGYNPISRKDAMMRRKFYHKLWQQFDEFNEAGCTGCGRCNEICPGNVNWLEVIKRIEKRSK